MCLAIPGRILDLTQSGELTRAGRVDFDGVIREVNLALLPDAQPGDFVLVHVGLALSRIDEEEARRTLDYFRQIGELADQELPTPTPTPTPSPSSAPSP